MEAYIMMSISAYPPYNPYLFSDRQNTKDYFILTPEKVCVKKNDILSFIFAKENNECISHTQNCCVP